MVLDSIPEWAFLPGVILLVLAAIEAGYRLVKTQRFRIKPDSEALVSVVTGSVLGLLGFVLAFTFGIVYNRFEARKELVREEANAIQRVWLRSDFLTEPDRTTTVGLLKQYLDLRLQAAEANVLSEITHSTKESTRIQHELWDLAVTNVKKDRISGLNAPYIQSLNDLIDIHGRRLAVGVEDRIPIWIWVSLGTLLLLSMVTLGYFSGLKGTHRSYTTIILAISFSVMFLLISALDRPLTGLFKASQQPLINVKNLMSK
ncbi:MAG TPA: hypothetical protein VMH01_08905 [Puia sp.]|nr:hypothetical protein [Puia sp.]